MTCVTDSSE